MVQIVVSQGTSLEYLYLFEVFLVSSLSDFADLVLDTVEVDGEIREY